MLTNSSKSAHWRLVRKGVAPAFSQQNMRRVCSVVLSRCAWCEAQGRTARHANHPKCGHEARATYESQAQGSMLRHSQCRSAEMQGMLRLGGQTQECGLLESDAYMISTEYLRIT